MVLSLLFIIVQTVSAGDSFPLDKTYFGQGQLIAVRMTVADGKARIFLLGKEAARADLKNPKLLKLTAFVDDGQKQELRFSEDGESYIAKLPSKPNLSLTVSTQLGTVKESIQVKLDKP